MDHEICYATLHICYVLWISKTIGHILCIIYLIYMLCVVEFVVLKKNIYMLDYQILMEHHGLY